MFGLKFTRWRFVLFAGVSLLAIFRLPYLVPVAPSVSDSYVFGYNNRAGIVLLLIAVVIGVLWSRGMGLDVPLSHSSAPHIPRWVLAASLLLIASGCLAMVCFAGRYEGFGESSYFIDRLWLLAQGKRPYIDFEFAYGAAMLYIPLALGRIFSLSISNAYYIFWALNHLCGTVLLFWIIDHIEGPVQPRRVVVYLLFFIPSVCSVYSMGANYSSFRFLFPVFLVFLARRAASRGLAFPAYFRFVLLCCSMVALLLLISPETAIAFAFACICIVAFQRPRLDATALAAAGTLLIGLILVFGAAAQMHALDTLLADSGGAISFPILPAPHLLVFFTAVFLCSCYVYACCVRGQLNNDLLALVAYSLPMLAAALGRCDPGHVSSNGMGFLLVAILFLPDGEPLATRFRACYLIFSFALPLIGGLLLYMASWQKAAHLNSLSAQDYKESYAVDLSRLYPAWHGSFFAPFGYRPNGLGSLHTDRVSYGHFEPMIDDGTPAAVRMRISELSRNADAALLLPEDFDRRCEVNVPGERVLIGVLFVMPYFGTPMHKESMRRPLCDFIHAHYQMSDPPTTANFRYGLWRAAGTR